ncbi:efflux RND transporter permease subunit [bacterium]|nr:efflux RND transporter permease subunit [bacterium]
MNRLVEWFTGNHVAANLLMLFIILAGLMSLKSIKQEVFPSINLDRVIITVPYLGASPDDVEEAVCVRVEESIQGIDGIKRITSTAVENSGTVIAEMELGVDQQRVLDDIKQAVDRIITFPAETEKPVVQIMVSKEQAINVVVYGDVDEKSLKVTCEKVRDDLLLLPEVSLAEVVGTRPYEISIEVSEESLRKYGLTFEQVTGAVRAGSMDLPGGSVKTNAGEILVRTKGQRFTGKEFADITVISTATGVSIKLGEIATVIDGFKDQDSRTSFDGKPAAQIAVYRAADESVLDVTGAVNEYIELNRDALPAGLTMEAWADRAVIYRGRMELMTRNGVIGLILVFGCLALFLQPRLAFWVALGIPISFMGGFWILPWFGGSLNMISMFAFIIVLGLVVDDAIVIGENIYAHRQMGKGRYKAAIEGTKEVATPVILAVTTTVIAFYPLAAVDGIMGKFMGVIPIVVISVLLVSLVEGLLILPAHLSTVPDKTKTKPRSGIMGLQEKFATGFENFIEKKYKPVLQWSLCHKAIVSAIATASMLLLIGYVSGGHIKFVFMPKIDADNMICVVNMPAGTTVQQTEKAITQITSGLNELDQELSEKYGQTVFKHTFTTIGTQPRGGVNMPGGGTDKSFSGAHKAEINVELVKGEDREAASSDMIRRWRELTGPVPGVVSVTFSSNLFHGSAPLELQMSSHNVDLLTEASEKVKLELSSYPGVTDVTDSYEEGKVELKLKLKPEARTLGLTLSDLARQVRQGFYGAEALRIQRSRDDVRVMIRYPESNRQSIGDIEKMLIRTPDGAEVPFSKVAIVDRGRGYASISRMDRRRIVSVIADVDEKVTNAGQVQAALTNELIPKLRAEYPSLHFSFEGEDRDKKESMESLGNGFIMALILIFALLAVLFRSYTQPLIIMTAIPFGFLGAVLGHVIMGKSLTLLSSFGVVALTGVVVNDSLIMVDFINRKLKTDGNLKQAVIESGTRRFRPIILTSLTTFAGLSPLLLEKSLQAQFLIPMAISLGFGVLFATAITLILVPVSYTVLEDFKRKFGHGRKID